MKSVLIFLLTAACWNPIWAGDFSVKNTGDDFQVLYKGNVLVDSIVHKFSGVEKPYDLKRSHTVLPDGREVWNIWSEHKESRFRQEIVLTPAKDEVEITMLTEATAWPRHPVRIGNITVPWNVVENMSYDGKTGRTVKVTDVTGKLDSSIKEDSSIKRGTNFRQFAVSDGRDFNIVFDMNPLGVGDFVSDYVWNCIRGQWGVYRRGGKLLFEYGDNFGDRGAHIGGKMRIYAGKREDYKRYHHQTFSGSGDPFPPIRLYSFGSEAHGENYKTMDLTAAGDKQDGWLDNGNAQVTGNQYPGVYYSALAGKNGKFKLSDLEPGLYIITLGAGNYGKTENRFRIRINGELQTDFFSIEPQHAVNVTIPIWLEKSDRSAVIELEGDYLLSTIGVQALLHSKEDYSFRRGIWAVDGFEPSVMYRNEHYRPAAKLKAASSKFFLPEPGRETAAEFKKLDYPIAVETVQRPGMAWRYSARFSALGSGNDSSINEYTFLPDLERRLDLLESKHINTIIVNGMLSRHTYKKHIDRAAAELKKISKAAHARGMKVIDHQDLTLLWNIDQGFRVMCERIGETDRRLDDMLPTPHFCPVNPVHREKAYQYFTDFILKTGIDALMIDEVAFWTHNCLCASCLEKFHADTNWYYPVNELDPRLKDKNDPLWKAFREWRKREIGSWWVGLRKRVKAHKPDFSFVAYNTHYGFSANWASLSLGLDLLQVGRGVDFLGTEIMSRNVLESHRSVMTYRKMKNVLRYAYNAPVFGLVYPENHWDLAYFGWALNNMNGQLTWETVMERPEGKSDYHAFATENMNVATAQPAVRALLLFSAQSRDWNRSFGYRPELMGTAQTLEELHIPYDMISEFNLKKDFLAQYDLLYVGASGCLSDKQLAVIKEFARNGGKVVISPLAGIFDELGNTRSAWGFEDVFGFTYKFEKLRSLWVSSIFDAAGREIPLKKKLIYYRPDNYTAHKNSMYFVNYGGAIMPVSTAVKYGKGEFIMHHCSFGMNQEETEHTPGDKYQFDYDEKLAEVFGNILKHEFASSIKYFSTDAPKSVYTSVFRDGKSDIVHLLNASGRTVKFGETVKRGAPQVPFPEIARDITFSLHRTEAVNSVYAVSPDFDGRQQLDFKVSCNKVTVRLPKELLKAYTIVFIK